MIYFDHASTTPIKPIALWAIEKAPYANPNSIHSLGLEAKKALLEAEQESPTAHITPAGKDSILKTNAE